MKILKYFSLSILIALVSCKKHNADSIIISDGTYIGTSGVGGALIYPAPPSAVTLVIRGQTYSCYYTSAPQNLTTGTMLISGQKVFFTPSSYSGTIPLLSGGYDAAFIDNYLNFKQTDNGITTIISVSKQ